MKIEDIKINDFYFAQIEDEGFVSRVKVMNKTPNNQIIVKTQYKLKNLTSEEIIAPIIRSWWRRLIPFYSLND